ncbi:hypothetical protein COLO4_25675 [Corchorus olitorius]|uniref:Uncharacterized protein n=1 Tax=Corchorus olitorius TaxID=93759 RepID=A0A1R3I0J2_9ROSI|nr:hypothetical protein COLO4_25675 [Corchorus olitorius]
MKKGGCIENYSTRGSTSKQKKIYRAAKDKRTRELLAAYKKQVGLNVDPKLRSECEKAMKDSDSLMDSGKFKDTLSYYEKVMEKVPYKVILCESAKL